MIYFRFHFPSDYVGDGFSGTGGVVMKIYILKQTCVALKEKRMTGTTIEIFVFDSKISRILGRLTQKIEISRITDDQFPQTTVA